MTVTFKLERLDGTPARARVDQDDDPQLAARRHHPVRREEDASGGPQRTRRDVPRSAAFVYAGLLGASALALTLYVASEDDYRRGGISRWQAYDAHTVTVAAIAIGLGAAVASVGAATRRRTRLAIIGFLSSSAAFALFFAAFLANALN
jgi:hypothetical protein